jgi:hypothetical protein
MIYDKLKVYNDGGMIVFQDNTASIPFLSEPKGSVRIRPFGANGFSFEYLVNGEPIGSVNNYDDVLDSSGVVYGASQLAVLTALNSFFFELGGGDILYTIELIDALTVDFYAPYDLKINTVTDILNSPTTTIEDDGVPYTLTNTILAGSKVTVTVDTAAVVNLNITKA